MLLPPHGAPGSRGGPKVVDASGLELQLEDGRTVLDFAGSPGVLGHRHPRMVGAMREATKLPAVGEAHDLAEREAVADELLATAFADEPWAAGVRFCVTASEAIDLGLALAQIIADREPLVAREMAYHGASGLARAVSTSPLLRGGLVDGAGGWRHPPRGVDLRILPAPKCPTQTEALAADGVGHVHGLDDAQVELEDAAALITDYGSGSIYPCAAYQDEAARVARAAGAFWLQDEAVTGFGRTGRWFAFQRGEERPDLVALGKGLTAGYAPGGALVLSQEMLDLLEGQRWVTFSTWRGHTLSLAAIRATLSVIDEENLLQRADALGAIIGDRLHGWVTSHPCVERVSGEGIVWNIDLKGPQQLMPGSWDGDVSGSAPAQRLQSFAMDGGLSVRAMGALGLWFFPSMNVSERDLERALDALDGAMDMLDAEQVNG